jgi:hypothetical protein
MDLTRVVEFEFVQLFPYHEDRSDDVQTLHIASGTRSFEKLMGMNSCPWDGII